MSTDKPVFTGAERPNTTQIPNVYLDHFLADLSGNEFKLLMYLSRRIFGFHKESDNISLGQMLHGIRRRNGEQLDYGTGLSKPTLLRALKELQEKGLVIAEQRKDPVRGDVATNYRLRIFMPSNATDQSLTPPGKKMSHGEEKLEGGSIFSHGVEQFSTTPVVKKHATQKKDVQKKVNSIHHHAATAAKSDDASVSQSKTPRSIAALQTIPGSRVTTVTEPVGKVATSPNPALVARLVATGVSQRQAERLVRSHPSDRIEAALSSLPFRNAKNPAGYLVREIEDGGWLPPVAIQEQEKKTASAAKRKAADEKAAQLEAERTRAAEARLRQVEHVVQALAPELVAELWSEARAQVMKFSRLAANDATEQNPFLKAAFSNLVQDRFLGGSE